MRYSALTAKILGELRASYWFLPTVLVVIAVALSQITLFLDRNPAWLPIELPNALKRTQANGARSVLSVIAQSVIGVTGVMFSTTIVAVSFAAGNYGPRLIGNFMKDRGNQWSLGILIATFVYSVFVLRAVQSPSDGGSVESFVPHLSILVSFAVLLVSVLTMIFFVHHIPETINVSNITSNIGRRFVRDIKDRIGEIDPNADYPIPDREPDFKCFPPYSGYIQAINADNLKSLAQDHDLVVEIPMELDAFVTPQFGILRIWGQGLDDDIEKRLVDCFAFGPSRTEHRNFFFLVDKLVEMIARALSPGINDPFTAINCLNWLHAGLSVALSHEGGLQAGNWRVGSMNRMWIFRPCSPARSAIACHMSNPILSLRAISSV